jgi:hypothetical protein
MVVQDSRRRLESRRGGGGKEKVERAEMLAKMVGRRADGCCVLWFVGEEVWNEEEAVVRGRLVYLSRAGGKKEAAKLGKFVGLSRAGGKAATSANVAAACPCDWRGMEQQRDPGQSLGMKGNGHADDHAQSHNGWD